MKRVVFTNITHAVIGRRPGITVEVRALLLGHVIDNDPESRVALTGFGVSCAANVFDITATRLAYEFDAEHRELHVPGLPIIRLARERADNGLNIEITEFENPAP